MPGLTQLGDLGRQSAGLRGPLAQSAPVRVALIAGIFLSVFRLRKQWKEEHGFCGVESHYVATHSPLSEARPRISGVEALEELGSKLKTCVQG